MKTYRPFTNTNPVNREYHEQFPQNARWVPWTEPGLYVTRLRMIGDNGILDVSYCHGKLPLGEQVNVILPFSRLPFRGLNGHIVRFAIKDGVHARDMGILSNLSILH